MNLEKGFSVPVDLIRVVAIVGVILLHASNDLTIQQMNTLEIFRWTTVDVYQSIGRLGVPLFVMLTGALLLQPSKNESLSAFFKKRWARIGLPWIFWGAAYFAWDFLVDHQAFTSRAIIEGILHGPYYQFWYLYMLVGLYLLTPIVRIFIAHSDRTMIKYFMVLWFLGASIIPVIDTLTTYHVSKDVFALTGYVGYFVLGTYLLTVKIRRSTLTIFMILGIALTAIGTYALASTVGGGEQYFFQEYLSPTLILASVMVFLLTLTVQAPSVQKVTRPSAGNKLVRVISENSLALFLFHVMILESLQRGYFGFAINGNTVNSIIGVPLNTALTLFVSLGIIVLLEKIPYFKKLIGEMPDSGRHKEGSSNIDVYKNIQQK
jgi:surface polysaccharide O-acyltransferase-like enzyme